jgi:hypothetical protein
MLDGRDVGRVGVGIAWMFLFLMGTAQGVVVSTTTDNTTRPPDDPGWSNVGVTNGATVIYLGDRWVITAAHVGIGSVTFPGIGTYTEEAGSLYRPSNPTGLGLTPLCDLGLFRLSEEPPLPPLAISPSTPRIGQEVVFVGNGRDRQPNPTYWDVSASGAVWNWTETANPSDYMGYKTASTNALRWGTNLIEDDELVRSDFDADIQIHLETVEGDTIAVVTEFDHEGKNSDHDVITTDGHAATRFESQAVLADSGGAMFYKRAGRWELSGIILAVEGHRNQPDVTRTAIFGDFTYIADLSAYRARIEDRFVFGDFNGDRSLGIADISQLTQALTSGGYDASFDLNRDGRLTSDDHRSWVMDVFGTYLGDANLDGEFGTGDLVQVLQFGQYEDSIARNSSWSSGDWNGDLEFNTSDLIVALQTGGFEKGPRDVSTSAAAAVPEPLGFTLGWTGVLGWSLCRRGRHRVAHRARAWARAHATSESRVQ